MPKINLPRPQVNEHSGPRKEGGVYIAQNITRQSAMLDRNGNQINPRTKQIIKINTNE